jgi:protein-S-isoprenylcysteine O-methyltransferase Ste14/predicted DCC family thiol-disulfide oxidoreductase YuxK
LTGSEAGVNHSLEWSYNPEAVRGGVFNVQNGHGREDSPTVTNWNVAKTVGQRCVFWVVLLAGVPWLLGPAEAALGLQGSRFVSPFWEGTGAALLGLGAALDLASSLALAVYGGGTPLPLDRPRALVVAGPYRHVRNPMAVARVTQVLGLGLMLGSPLVLAAALADLLGWNYLVRPAEEADLERRFGDAYRLYRRRVSCWRPRLRGYDPRREADEPPVAAERTRPPGRYLVLYDGRCRFCTAGVRRLLALAPAGALEAVDFQQPGVLDQLPGVSHAACLRRMHLVTPAGHVYGGFEAAVQALALRPVLGWLARAYYLPGVRLVLDLLYALVAANRYRIMGKTAGCEDGTCAVHLRRPSESGACPSEPEA